MYIAIVAYLGPEALKTQIEVVGLFQSQTDAEFEITNFIENFLEIERPNFSKLNSKVIKLER